MAIKNNQNIESPLFDTLKYAQRLRQAGIQSAEKCTEALSFALGQNIITKNGVDKMFARALRDSEKRQQRMERESEMRSREMKEYFTANMTRIEKEGLATRMEFNQKITEITDLAITKLTRNIGILVACSSLIGIVLHFI